MSDYNYNSDVSAPAVVNQDQPNVISPIAGIFESVLKLDKHRDIGEFRQRMLQEADINGDQFFYSWMVRDGASKKLITGLTIQAARAILRNYKYLAVFWGMTVQEGNKITLNPIIIDLVNGIFYQKPFTMSLAPAPGRFAESFPQMQRWESTQFQIAASKAVRNVILDIIPNHILDEILERSRKALKFRIDKEIKKDGISAVADRLTAKLISYGVPLETILRKIGKRSKADITKDDLALLTTDIIALQNNTATIADLYGDIEEETEAEQAVRNLTEKMQKENKAAADKADETKPVMDETNKASEDKPKQQKTQGGQEAIF
ncbi:hypothetical protein D6827_04135 [Candidatus Parcubacteria bacterium]|nr:MAG: hypothetical protein D6827_04135 [Candidatus Parcubacteria bacterium]